MTTISLELPESLDLRLAEEAQRRHTTKSALIQECVAKALSVPAMPQNITCLDLAGDLVGCLDGPTDIATNPKYLEDLGE